MTDQMLANCTVLVVEDEMLVMMAIEDMLADLGCTSIAAAGNIEQALELIATNDFDFATLDVNLNGQRSDSVAAALDQRGILFAYSTGYGTHGIRDGFADRPTLAKPFGRQQLEVVVAELIAAAGRRRRTGA